MRQETMMQETMIDQVGLVLHYEITMACNLECLHCFNGVQIGKHKSGATERPLPDIMEIGHKFVEAGASKVLFTGGEPLMRPQIVIALGTFLSKHNIGIGFVSNGTLIDANLVRWFKEVQVKDFVISLHSPDADLHDDIVGVKGSFQRTLKGVRLLVEAGLGEYIRINMVVNKKNLHQIINMGKFVASLGLKSLSAARIIPPWTSSAVDHLLLSRDDARDIFRSLSTVRKEFGLNVDTVGGFPHCLGIQIEGLPRRSACTAGTSGGITVGPEGDVRPCALMPFVCGNLLVEKFGAAWDRMSPWRNGVFVPKQCHKCSAYHVICDGGCRVTAHYGGDLAGVDMHADLLFSECFLQIKESEENYYV